MKSPSARYLDLVERRLELLRTLIRLQAEWRASFIGLRLEQSERCVAEEEIACAQILSLDKDLAVLRQSPIELAVSRGKGIDAASPMPFELDPILYPKIIAAMERMVGLHLELKRSNRSRQAILNRSKLTVNALRNFFNSYAPTYAAPAAVSTGTMYEENV
jgi:hypothetical protein